MGNAQYFGKLILVFILALEGGLMPAYAQRAANDNAMPAANDNNNPNDIWSETTTRPRPTLVQERPTPATAGQQRPQTSTISLSGPQQDDGTRETTQIEIPRAIDGTTIPDGRQIEIELEGGRNPMPSYQEMMEAFQVYREVADRRLLETFENATRATIQAPLQVLYQRWERAKATMHEFPQEAFLFFWGMGAVTFFQLQWTAHKDPAAWQYFLEHQFSSTGAIGFWFFMYANRESAAIMNAAIYGRSYRDSVRMLRQQGMANPENVALQQAHLSGNVSRGAQFFSRFVPYLSMTVGFTAQNIVSTLIGDPDFQKCAMNSIRDTAQAASQWTARQVGITPSADTPQIRAGFVPEPVRPAEPAPAPGQSPCEKSYNWLVVRKKIYEAAPGLISMLGSTVISGLVEQPVYRMVGRAYTRSTNAVAQLSRAAAVRLLMGSSERTAKIILSGSVSLMISAARGGHAAILKSAHVISKLSNIILFTGIDVGGLNSYTTRRFRNVFEASHLGRRSSKMYERILHAKFERWNDSSIRPLKAEVEKFAQASSEWREAQALDAIMAHSNWINPLIDMMNNYHASKVFYEDIVKELTKYKQQSRPGESKIDRDLGVYGMNPSLDAGGLEEYNPYSLPDVKEYYEITYPSVLNAYRILQESLATYSSQIPRSHQNGYNFTKQHVDQMKNVVEQITCANETSCEIPATMNLAPIDQFVDQISRLYYREYHHSDLRVFGYDPAFIDVVKRAYTMLSLKHDDVAVPEAQRQYVRPIPQLNKGYWFIRAVNDYNPLFKSFTEHLELSNSISGFRVRYKGDYYLLNMLCGPDIQRSERTIRIFEGFSPQFTPPSLVANKPDVCSLYRQDTHDPLRQNSPRTDYSPLQRQNADQDYIALLEYLKQNIETRYLTLSPLDPYENGTRRENNVSVANLRLFWEQNVFTQVENILKLWVLKYDDVSAELLKSINTNPQNWVNNIAIRQGGFLPGPFSTKVKEAATQEFRVYLMLLGEMFKDLPKAPITRSRTETPAADPAADRRTGTVISETREPQNGAGGYTPSNPRSAAQPRAASVVPGITYRTSESTYLNPAGWRRLMEPRYTAARVGAPLFWYLRDQDPMDFATIAFGFETPQNQQRLTPNNNAVRFQTLALAAFKDVTDLFSRYEIQEESRSNPSGCWLFLNQSFMCRQWNSLKDVFGLRNERMYRVTANVTKEEEEAKLKAFEEAMTQIETGLNAALHAENSNARLSNDQKLFIEDLIKRSKALGEAMKHLLSMLRLNEVGAQINSQSQGREQIQGPNGGSLLPGR